MDRSVVIALSPFTVGRDRDPGKAGFMRRDFPGQEKRPPGSPGGLFQFTLQQDELGSALSDVVPAALVIGPPPIVQLHKGIHGRAVCMNQDNESIDL